MKEFMRKHPALKDTCDTVLSLLSGSFALLAVEFVRIKELVERKKKMKRITERADATADIASLCSAIRAFAVLKSRKYLILRSI